MTEQYRIEVFFDGDCPLCMREINFLKRRKRSHLIKFTDISAQEFRAENFGLTQQEFMAKIKGRLPDGTFVEGVEVFRQLYSTIGLSWLVAITRAPGLSHLLNFCYRWFAKNRLRLTGRCSDDSCATHSS